MMKFAPLLLLVSLSLVGCIPLSQLERGPSRVQAALTHDTCDKYVLFAIGDENRKKAYRIVEAKSYALDPTQKRHPVKAIPHRYDLEQHFPFVRDDVYVLKSPTDPRPIHLRTGHWVFVLALDSSGQIRLEKFPFRLWTFYYNPIIHGPPN